MVVLVILGHVPRVPPEYPVLEYVLLGYPGTKAGCFGHNQVCTRVPNLVVLVVLGHVTGFPQGLSPITVYTLAYPGTKPGWFGPTRVGTRVFPEYILSPSYILTGTRVPKLVVLVILRHAPEYPQSISPKYTLRYPCTIPGCFGHTRVGTRVFPEYTP